MSDQERCLNYNWGHVKVMILHKAFSINPLICKGVGAGSEPPQRRKSPNMQGPLLRTQGAFLMGKTLAYAWTVEPRGNQ